jgi:glycopeptide antibiotics resistance protein
MFELIIHFLRSRRERVILVIASATMIAAAFALFISASSATTLTTDKSLSQYWRTTYEILVRAPAIGGAYRGVNINDVLLNAVGVLIGYGIFRVFTWLYLLKKAR